MYIMYDFKVGRLGLQGKPYLGSRKGVPGVTERGTGVGRGVITSGQVIKPHLMNGTY